MERTENPICLRYSGYFLGLNLLCLGINLNIVSQLGVAAFSTLPYTLSQIFTQLTFGQMNVIIYGILVLLQLLIERCFPCPSWRRFLFRFCSDLSWMYMAHCFLPQWREWPCASWSFWPGIP